MWKRTPDLQARKVLTPRAGEESHWDSSREGEGTRKKKGWTVSTHPSQSLTPGGRHPRDRTTDLLCGVRSGEVSARGTRVRPGRTQSGHPQTPLPTYGQQEAGCPPPPPSGRPDIWHSPRVLLPAHQLKPQPGAQSMQLAPLWMERQGWPDICRKPNMKDREHSDHRMKGLCLECQKKREKILSGKKLIVTVHCKHT